MIERDKEYYNQKISELYSIIENQEKIIRELQEKINTYEDPEDLTLFYMWIDNKAKDKMKELETEIFGLNDRLSCANEEIDLYKNIIDKAIEYIEHYKPVALEDKILEILKGEKNEKGNKR